MAHLDVYLALDGMPLGHSNAAGQVIPPAVTIRQLVSPQYHLTQKVVFGDPVPIPHVNDQLVIRSEI